MTAESWMAFDQIRDEVRILLILEAAERANLAPLPALAVHSFAYLANVLAPIWNVTAYEGTVFKSRAAPYYPAVQRSLDRLIGRGIVLASTVDYQANVDGRWVFTGSFVIDRSLAAAAVEEALHQPELNKIAGFFLEIALALSACSSEEFSKVTLQDATYADPRNSAENVVDFAQWNQRNYSAQAASSFGKLAPDGVNASRGEQLNLYVRHLYRMLSRSSNV